MKEYLSTSHSSGADDLPPEPIVPFGYGWKMCGCTAHTWDNGEMVKYTWFWKRKKREPDQDEGPHIWGQY